MLTVLRSLKRELVRAQEEIKRIQSVPLVIGQFLEPIDQKYAKDSRSSTIIKLKDGQHGNSTVVDRLQLCRSHPLHP